MHTVIKPEGNIYNIPCVYMYVCPLTLRGSRRKGLGVQQIQSALILLVFLLSSRGGFLGSTTFLVVQLATLGQESGSSGFGWGLDHCHQARTLLLTTGVLLQYACTHTCSYKRAQRACLAVLYIRGTK